jgi:hypothetical protein
MTVHGVGLEESTTTEDEMPHQLTRVRTEDGRTVTRPDDWTATSRSAMAEWREAWAEGVAQARRAARGHARNAARRLWMDRDWRELSAAGFWGAV